MEITKGAINFPFNFDYSLIPSTKYIALTKLKKNSLMDNTASKYIKEIKISHTGGTNYDIKLTYEDNTTTTVTKTYADVSTYLSGRITEIKTVGFIETDANVITLTNALKLCVDETVNCIFFYLLNSDKHTVDKSLIYVNCDYVEYNRYTSHKNIILNIKQNAFDDKYNYVFLNILNRYYYVADAVLQNDIFTLTLREDVLMSFKDLIVSQTAYVERNEFTYNDELVDDLVSNDYSKSVLIQTVTPTNDIFPSTTTEENNRESFILTVVSGF